jgi:hypothetical protein
MKRQLAILFLMGVCSLAAGPAAVAGTLPEPAAPVVTDPDGVETTATEAAAPRGPESLSPCQQAIRALLDREAAQLSELEARVPAAVDGAAFLSLQREIERVKQDTELQVMRTQAQYARLEGRVEQAERIEAALAEMAAPRPAAAPTERTGETLRDGAQQR